MTPSERIERMVQTGAVSSQEGARLLATMGASPAPRAGWRLLFDPFERIGGAPALLGGAVVGGLSLLVSRLGVHFDGALDCHVAAGRPASLVDALAEQGLAWGLVVLLFWGYARVVTTHVRVVDFLGFVGLARAPLVLTGLLALGLAPNVTSPADIRQHLPALIAVGLLSLPLLVWFGVLLYRGFKNASGLSGGKLWGGFVGVLVVAECASKALLHLMH